MQRDGMQKNGMRQNRQGRGAAAGAAAALVLCGLLCIGNGLTAHAQVELMEDGTLFDPVWFREQYPEAEGSQSLAQKAAEEEEDTGEEEPADNAAGRQQEDDSRKTSGSREETDSQQEVDSRKTSGSREEADSRQGNDSQEEAGSRQETGSQQEDERNMVSTAELSTDELYRLYQLYGQRDGLLPYDDDSFKGTFRRELKKAAASLKSRKDRELGESWETITAEIYDTDSVHVWGTEYLISSETAAQLEEIIDRFETEGYEIGFVMADMTTGDAISYHAGAEIYSASVIKAPYIFSLLESGIPLTRDIYLAGNQSDNDAYARIRSTYGNQIFIDWLQGTGVPDKQGATRYIITTPLDLCRMFYKGTGLLLGDSEASEWARTTFTDSLNSAAALTIGLSDDKKVYSKAGWIASEGSSIENSYTNGAVIDEEYPYVVAVMSNSLGYVGVEYAKELMPILGEIHDEMVDPEKAVSTEVTAEDISDFADDAQGAVRHGGD